MTAVHNPNEPRASQDFRDWWESNGDLTTLVQRSSAETAGYVYDVARRAYEGGQAARAQCETSSGVPAGWKLVPVEPTRDMRKAFHEAHERYEDGGEDIGSPDDEWKAMLTATPTPEAGQSGVPKWMREISENLKMQNNRITQDPLFVVFQKRDMVTNEGFDYDRISWGSCDGEAPDHIQDELNELYDDVESDHWRDDQITLTTDDGTETWQRAAIKEIDEFVTACFTEVGAKAYLESNGHNLRQPFIFVTSLYRNEEMKQLRDWLHTHPHTNQPDSGAGDGWISVDAMVPKMAGWYCVALADPEDIGWCTSVSWMAFWNGWSFEECDPIDDGQPVTHWMPLPEPPQQGVADDE